MGKAPLPFDPRNACFCNKACSDFHLPSTRYWVVVDTQGDVPELDSGIFHEILNSGISGGDCSWQQSPPPPITQVVQIEKVSEALFPAAGYRWIFKYQDAGAGFFYRAELIGTGTRCDGDKDLAVVFAPNLWGPAKMIQILWYQNADDVPH